jgi:hypothetical protein
MAESHEEEPGAEGEHLPGPSFWPVLLAVGVAMSLIGVITKVVVVVIGLIILVVALGGWIRDARRDYRSLS